MNEASPNREYRSSVFASYFNDPARLIELYNALSGHAYLPDTPIRINTLEKALYYDRVNDLSFELDGRLIVVFEHQSTWNPNMPFRILLYIAKLYEKTYTNAAPFYSTTLQKIDAVECFVLYNGIEKHAEKDVWKLSDMFRGAGTETRLELQVPVYNINDGFNSAILEKSRSLTDYARFVNLVNHYRTQGLSLKEAVDQAVNECINNGVMADYLTVHGSEVRGMLFAEFNLDEVAEVRVIDRLKKAIYNLTKQGLDDAHISDALDVPLSKVDEYRREYEETVEKIFSIKKKA